MSAQRDSKVCRFVCAPGVVVVVMDKVLVCVPGVVVMLVVMDNVVVCVPGVVVVVMD